MTTLVKSTYQRIRKPVTSPVFGVLPGATAQGALRVARDYARIKPLIDCDLIRIDVRPDDMCDLDDVFGDTFDVELNASSVPGGERTIKAQHKEAIRRVEQFGIVGIVSQYRLTPDSQWIDADSCWGFEGYYSPDDPIENDCALDLLLSAREQLINSLQDRYCKRCGCKV